MKIAIPSETDAGLESIRSGHFGHAAYMTVVEFDDDMNTVGVESVKNADHDAVGCGGVIDFVSGIGVDGILSRRLFGLLFWAQRSGPLRAIGNARTLTPGAASTAPPSRHGPKRRC